MVAGTRSSSSRKPPTTSMRALAVATSLIARYLEKQKDSVTGFKKLRDRSTAAVKNKVPFTLRLGSAEEATSTTALSAKELAKSLLRPAMSMVASYQVAKDKKAVEVQSLPDEEVTAFVNRALEVSKDEKPLGEGVDALLRSMMRNDPNTSGYMVLPPCVKDAPQGDYELSRYLVPNAHRALVASDAALTEATHKVNDLPVVLVTRNVGPVLAVLQQIRHLEYCAGVGNTQQCSHVVLYATVSSAVAKDLDVRNVKSVLQPAGQLLLDSAPVPLAPTLSTGVKVVLSVPTADLNDHAFVQIVGDGLISPKTSLTEGLPGLQRADSCAKFGELYDMEINDFGQGDDNACYWMVQAHHLCSRLGADGMSRERLTHLAAMLRLAALEYAQSPQVMCEDVFARMLADIAGHVVTDAQRVVAAQAFLAAVAVPIDGSNELLVSHDQLELACMTFGDGVRKTVVDGKIVAAKEKEGDEILGFLCVRLGNSENDQSLFPPSLAGVRAAWHAFVSDFIQGSMIGAEGEGLASLMYARAGLFQCALAVCNRKGYSVQIMCSRKDMTDEAQRSLPLYGCVVQSLPSRHYTSMCAKPDRDGDVWASPGPRSRDLLQLTLNGAARESAKKKVVVIVEDDDNEETSEEEAARKALRKAQKKARKQAKRDAEEKAAEAEREAEAAAEREAQAARDKQAKDAKEAQEAKSKQDRAAKEAKAREEQAKEKAANEAKAREKQAGGGNSKKAVTREQVEAFLAQRKRVLRPEIFSKMASRVSAALKCSSPAVVLHGLENRQFCFFEADQCRGVKNGTCNRLHTQSAKKPKQSGTKLAAASAPPATASAPVSAPAPVPVYIYVPTPGAPPMNFLQAAQGPPPVHAPSHTPPAASAVPPAAAPGPSQPTPTPPSQADVFEVLRLCPKLTYNEAYLLALRQANPSMQFASSK